MFRSAVFGVLVLGLVTGAQAGDLARHARFGRLHGEGAALELDGNRQLRGGLVITGEKIVLENGNLTASFQKVAHTLFVMSGITAQGRMPIDDAFLADPITTALNNILNGSTMTVASMKNAAPARRSSPALQSAADVEITNIKMVHTAKALKGSMQAMMFAPEFTGKSAYSKATKKLTVTVETIQMGGYAVPIDLAFYVMGQFMNYPFVTLAKPNLIIDLSSFLPTP